ncbi:MAG: TlpA family protein disulfide reductase [Bacteroidaceae bacterium]|nr:TlpA family protein disulfide reductase [Bacteroidaceae bacterium]
MRNILLMFICLSFFRLSAQENKIRVTVPADYSHGLVLYVSPVNSDDSAAPGKLELKDGVHEGSLPLSESGFYQIIGVREQAQSTLYIYQPGKGADVKIALSLKNEVLYLDNTSSNKILSNFNLLYAESARLAWQKDDLTSDDVYSMLMEYKKYSDSVASLQCCPQAVKEFVKTHVYNTIYSSVDMMTQIFKREGKELKFEIGDIMPEPHIMLDNDMAAYFYVSKHAITKDISPSLPLHTQIGVLYTNYKNDKVRQVIINHLLQRFISKREHERDFDADREQLVEVVKLYKLDNEYIEKFDMLKIKQKGAAFPSFAVLKDIDGNVVDVSQFKGKYIYIDLWASWCVPCLKEIPYLQKLESDYKDKDIVFLSVSIDSDEKAWKKTLAARNMHGHQLIDDEHRLSSALGVASVPFFIMYDKEGRLLEYRAPRPSRREELIKLLDSLNL